MKTKKMIECQNPIGRFLKMEQIETSIMYTNIMETRGKISEIPLKPNEFLLVVNNMVKSMNKQILIYNIFDLQEINQNLDKPGHYLASKFFSYQGMFAYICMNKY